MHLFAVKPIKTLLQRSLTAYIIVLCPCDFLTAVMYIAKISVTSCIVIDIPPGETKSFFLFNVLNI